MVIVLSLTMLVIGGALSAIYFNRDEAKLTDATQSIEILAKRARTVATLQQRPYALEFKGRTVSLMPLAEASMDEFDRDAMLEAREDRQGFLDEEEREESTPSVRDSWVAEDEMAVYIRRWATTDWIPLNPRDRHVWRFDPNGACEPVGVRIEVEGGSWVEIIFHPLTAAIAQTNSAIQ
jgi:hypothetical protein